MKINSPEFRVKPGADVDLKKWATEVSPVYESKRDYKEALARQTKELSELQSQLYADGRHSLLLIFQAMDAAGKDGAIKHVMSGINPQGCRVHSFKQPSAEELRHDFLWRAIRRLPERGQIGIFNRSYYEDVLIVRVHPELLKHQGLPEGLIRGKTVWKERYRSISELEAHLNRNGTHVVKFFLHLSRDEQKKRFLARIDEPDKNWKFSEGDVAERKFWNNYRHAYEACLGATSTKGAPWYVVPADDKKNARLIISDVILSSLRSLKMEYPAVSDERREELMRIRAGL
jgi:PPK2 family polyphosphate:nucleotide phosphotransferase